MIQSTSLQVYYSEVRPKLAEQQKKIIDCLMEKRISDFTNKEISRILGWEINSVTPRCLELRELGILEESCKRKDTLTGRTSIAWRLKRSEPIQIALHN